MTNSEKLAKINKFLAAHNRPLLSDYRKARHENLLNEVLAFEAKVEAATDELNAQIAAKADEPDALLIDPKSGAMVRESQLSDDDAELTANREKQVEAINSNDFANKEVAEAFKGKKQPSYKHLMAKSGKTSLVDKPVGFAHQFLTQHPELSRKEAVAALVEYGVNYATARTQYQRWFSGRK
jgi:hypothetical protein